MLSQAYYKGQASPETSNLASAAVDNLRATFESVHSTLGSSIFEYLKPVEEGVQQIYAHLPASTKDTISNLAHLISTSPEYLSVLVLTVLTALLVMSRWGFPKWGGRYSPFNSSGPPQVQDSDFSYVAPEDLEPSHVAYDQYYGPRNATRSDDSLAPDILILKHRGVTYPLHFPAYTIGDGTLTIGKLRDRAAKATGTDDPKRIKLLYKGRILKEDDLPAKDEGLKQQSELMAVIHEPLNFGGADEDSGSGDEDASASAGPDGTTTRKKRKNHRSKKKNKKKGDESPQNLTPPIDTLPSSTGTSRPTTPALANTPLEKLQGLSSAFHTKYVPLCVQFMNNPPADRKTRDFEYKKLSETILAQILLKVDAVETEGDDDARQQRRALVKEAQAMLNKLDEVIKQEE
ncbi:MAG: hypothetical protein M1834_009665 [Cirrosporium novae-zelandiae]|nr:MAG: hypothetical protein M1834_009665 [Cirrosporium novae-zelandiae]